MLSFIAVRTFIAALLLLVGLVAPAAAAAPPHSTASSAAQVLRHALEPEAPSLGPLTVSEKQAFGCMIAGGAALTLAVASTGLPAMVGLFTGTTLVPVTGPGLGLVAGGTVFASTCAVGALLTPGIIRLWAMAFGTPPAAPQ